MTENAATAEATDITPELIELMNERAKNYGFLARIYRVEVDEPFLAQMRTMRFPTSTGNEHVDEGYRLIYQYLRNGWEDSILDLARDYVRTFIGHGIGGYCAAYPYESVHTSEKRLLMQEARAEVLDVYRANLLHKSDGWKECEDHIAVELEFMQIMCLRTAECLEAGDEDAAIELLRTQYSFVNDHLANWVPMFVSDILHFSEADLYRGAGELTLGFVQTEQEILHDLLEGIE